MFFEKDGNISIITQEKVTIIELVKKLTILYTRFEHDNVIVSLTSSRTLTSSDVIEFVHISNRHRASNRSFVLGVAWSHHGTRTQQCDVMTMMRRRKRKRMRKTSFSS